jgi:hypothetical protein
MTRDKSVQAVFGTSLNTAVSGMGSVVAQPGAALLPYGTVVRLTAVPQPGNGFAFWSNAGSGTNNPLLYPVTTSNRTVTAVFASLGAGQYALTMLADGFGSVTNKPRGNYFPSGTSITLTALPAAGQEFRGWSGDASGSENPLTVQMTQGKVVTAQFTRRPTLALQPSSAASSRDVFHFLLTGDFGARYQVEKNDAWQGWSAFVTVTNSFGSSQVNDPTEIGQAIRAYRATATP